MDIDFDRGNPRELASGDGAFEILYGLHEQEGIGNIKQVQTKVRDDLVPVVASKKDADATQAYCLLSNLVEKVNKMPLVQGWGVESVDYYIGGYVESSTGEAVPILDEKRSPTEVEKLLRDLGPGQRILKILGNRWIINTKVGLAPGSAPGLDLLRISLYGIIIRSLEDGTLARLKVCKECHRFFVGERRSGAFCNPNCASSYWSKDTPSRMRKSRDEKRKAEEQSARQDAERRAFRAFSEFFRLARRATHSDEELSTLKPKLRALGGGATQSGWRVVKSLERKLNEGVSVRDIWENLPKEERRIFQTA